MHEIWLEADKLPLTRDIGIFGTPEPGWAHPDRIMEINLFIFVIEGEYRLWEDDIEYVLKKGHAMFLKKGIRQWGKADNVMGSHWFYIHFYDQPLDSNDNWERTPLHTFNKEAATLSKEVFQTKIKLPKKIELPNDSFIERKLKEMLQQYQLKQNGHQHLLLSIQAMELFLYLQQKFEARTPYSKADITVLKVVDILEKNSAGKITGDEIAAALKMNYNYLCEVFKKKTGLSILDYHLRLRVNKAAEVLKLGKLNISEVGELYGFSSPFYFSRIFKKITGYSPSDFLKNHYIN